MFFLAKPGKSIIQNLEILAGPTWMKNSQTRTAWKTKLRKPTFPETKSKSTRKWMVGILVSFWDGPFSGAMAVSFREGTCFLFWLDDFKMEASKLERGVD